MRFGLALLLLLSSTFVHAGSSVAASTTRTPVLLASVTFKGGATLRGNGRVKTPPPEGGGGGGVAGCGANTDNSGCGDVNVPAFDTSTYTDITACGTYTSAGNFRIAANIGSDPTVTCLTIGGSGQVWDGQDQLGYIVTGAVVRIGTSGPSDIRRMKIRCRVNSDVGNGACLKISSSSTGTCAAAPRLIRYNDIYNDITTSNAMAISVEHTPTVPCSVDQIQITHNRVQAGLYQAASRSRVIRVLGNANAYGFLIDYNHITNLTGSSIQGIELLNGTNMRANDNYLDLTELPAFGAANGRGVIFDNATNSEAKRNYVVARNNRPFRVRDSSTIHIENNQIVNLYKANGHDAYAFHMCDNDPGSMTQGADMDISGTSIKNNSIEHAGGGAITIFARGCEETGAHVDVSANTIVCTNGCTGDRFLWNTAPASIQTQSKFTVTDNPQATNLPAQILTDAGAVTFYRNSGTATGAGTNTPY